MMIYRNQISMRSNLASRRSSRAPKLHATPHTSSPPLLSALQLHLAMPAAVAQQISRSLQSDYDCVDVVSENISILSTLVPRSSMRSLERLLLTNPGVLLSPLGSWFDFLSAYGVSPQAFCGILQWQAGRIVTDSNLAVAGNVILTLQRWGLSSSDINRSVLQRAPQVLLLQQEHLQQLHSFLQQACALPGSRIRDLVVATPLVLLQDVEQQLQPRLCSLAEALGADQQQLAAVLVKLPGLLMADYSSAVQPRLQQLQMFGFLGPELFLLVCADPSVLTLSCSSLQRKWEFLTLEMGLGRQQVLQQCPSYFSKALVSEVGPRYSYVVVHGLQASVACQPATVAQQQQQQQQQQQLQLHLGKLLDPSIPEFLAALGRAGAAAEFKAHAQHWAQTEGLKWTAARVTSS